jgi:hypothetical protein
MKILLALSLILLTTGCAADPWSLAAIVTDTLVQLENTCEDPKVDAATYTFTEGMADVAAVPYNLLMLAGHLGAAFTVAPVMAIMGKDQQFIQYQINWVFPLYRAGPDPAKVRYHDHMIDPKYRPCHAKKVQQARNGS